MKKTIRMRKVDGNVYVSLDYGEWHVAPFFELPMGMRILVDAILCDYDIETEE